MLISISSEVLHRTYLLLAIILLPKAIRSSLQHPAFSSSEDDPGLQLLVDCCSLVTSAVGCVLPVKA